MHAKIQVLCCAWAPKFTDPYTNSTTNFHLESSSKEMLMDI